MAGESQMMKWVRGGVLTSAVGLMLVSGAAPGAAQSTNQQIETMEKQLDMNAKPDLAALGFQDDLTKLNQCQSGCRPLIDKMLEKYKSGANFGGNADLGAGDVQQLAASLATAAATLSKADAAAVQQTVASDLGPDAEAAFAGAYASTVAPYDPK